MPSGKRKNLLALPEKTRSTRMVEAANKYRSKKPERLRLGFHATEAEVQRAIDQELKRAYVIEGLSLRDIEAKRHIGFGYAGKRLQVILTDRERVIVKMHKLIRHTKENPTWRGRKRKVADMTPGQLEEYLKGNMLQTNREISADLGIETKAVAELFKTLEITPEARAKARWRTGRRDLMKRAIEIRKRNPKELGYNYLHHNNRPMLSEIMRFFQAEPAERDWNARAVYDRFLSAMGLNYDAVGIRPPRADAGKVKPEERKGGKPARKKGLSDAINAQREKVLAGMEKPMDVKQMRSLSVSNITLGSLVEDGLLLREKVGGKTHYCLPEQREQLEASRRKLTLRALREVREHGETEFRFGVKECKIAAMRLLTEAMSVSELITIDGVSFASTKMMRDALTELAREREGGKPKVIHYSVSRTIDCWYRPNQRGTVGRFEKRVDLHGRRRKGRQV